LAWIIPIGWAIAKWVSSVDKAPGPPRWTKTALIDELDRIEVLLLEGKQQRVAETLTRIESPIRGMQGPTGVLLRTRLSLAEGDFFGWIGKPEAAAANLHEAKSLAATIDDPVTALELSVRADVTLARMASSSAATPEHIQSGRCALDQEPRIRRPEVIMRLAWIAHHLADIDYQEGRWESARGLLERCVDIGRRLEQPGGTAATDSWSIEARELFWTYGRKVASEAARDLGHVFKSLGDRERAMQWLDRAVALVEGARLEPARLRLSQALIDRAMGEPVDAFTGLGSHEALLERAVEVALSCETAEGKFAAFRAEVAWAQLYGPIGLAEKQLEHLRRALALTAEMPEPAAGHNLTCLHAEMGEAYEANGDREQALISLQAAVERGRAHPEAETRRVAAQAAYLLHQLLVGDERVSDARGCVEVIEQVLPTLEPQARPAYASVAALSRGIQHVLEDHPEDARVALEQAESLARSGGIPSLARSAALELGRLALRARQPGDAEPHLRRALETQVPNDGSIQGRSRRAEIVLHLGHSLMGLDRIDEGLREIRHAHEVGRNTGDALGREVAAMAALTLGDAADEDFGERRRYYETAVRLGRLSGRAQGRKVAEAAAERLRDTA
jgi:tetratricopeptide (TPR) repeat protein